jgi:hypothetical protein
MTDANINYFLVVYDIENGLAHVQEFGLNRAAAVEAYGEAEETHREDENVEVVLLGSDSLETVERTHSSYFELADKHVDRMVARDLAEFDAEVGAAARGAN